MGKAESREVTSPAVMSALELGSREHRFNQRERERGMEEDGGRTAVSHTDRKTLVNNKS